MYSIIDVSRSQVASPLEISFCTFHRHIKLSVDHLLHIFTCTTDDFQDAGKKLGP